MMDERNDGKKTSHQTVEGRGEGEEWLGKAVWESFREERPVRGGF